eukprot:GHVN01020178.1.p2 GENE.GHVN01020178.1~~GHVN01020178.1.p2  ORF type:complete len:102 (-),score=0.82 GHVN01020178.1:1893-2198(-)
MKGRFMEVGASYWTSVRLQLVTYPLFLTNSIIPVVLHLFYPGTLLDISGFSREKANVGFVGLALAYSMSMSSAIGGLMGSFSILEREMCSGEHLDRERIEL